MSSYLQQDDSTSFQLHLPALALALLLALRGLRSTSLSKSGAVAALLYGYTTLASPLRVFGVCLLGFYLAGSKATKVSHLREGRHSIRGGDLDKTDSIAG